MSYEPGCADDPKNLEQESSADYKRYEVAGSPVQIGEQLAAHHGGQDGPRLSDLTAEQVSFARECAREAAAMRPEMVREVEAWGDACKLTRDEAYFYLSVGMTETSRQGRSRHASTRVAADENRQCSTVGLMTAQGPVIGRNFDLFYRVRVRHQITTKPDTGYAHAGMYDGLAGGRTDGLNEKGLFVSLQTVRTRPPAKRKPGLFCVHIARVVLEACSSAQQAAARIALLPHLASYNYFLADPYEMLVVEAHPERVRVRTAEKGVLASANHYVHPDMIELMRAEPPSSRARQEFLTQGARRILESLDENRCSGVRGEGQPARLPTEPRLPEAATAQVCAGVTAMMRDHTVPVCGHVDGMATLWSALAVPKLKWAAFSLGAPCRNQYIQAPL